MWCYRFNMLTNLTDPCFQSQTLTRTCIRPLSVKERRVMPELATSASDNGKPPHSKVTVEQLEGVFERRMNLPEVTPPHVGYTTTDSEQTKL